MVCFCTNFGGKKMAFDPSKYTVTKARPLPVVLLLDSSGSMSGEKIATLNHAVNEMIDSFKSGAGGNEVEIQMGIIRFGGDVKYEMPLQSVAQISGIGLQAGGGTPMGTAIEMAKDLIEDKEVIPSKGYRPTVVLVSDGAPTDNWEEPINKFISEGRSSKCDRMAMAIGTSQNDPVLNKFLSGTENKVFLASDASKIKDFFRMVTMSVSVRSKSSDPNKLLPAPQNGNGAYSIEKLNDMMDF